MSDNLTEQASQCLDDSLDILLSSVHHQQPGAGPALVGSTSLDSPAIPPAQKNSTYEISDSDIGIATNNSNKELLREQVEDLVKKESEYCVKNEEAKADKENVEAWSGEEKVGEEEKEEGEKEGEKREEGEELTERKHSADESLLIKLQDITNNDQFHHTFKTAANTSQDSLEFDEKTKNIMEFAKNYSDDLLMGSIEQQASSGNGDTRHESSSGGGGHDLADFELPPYSGSSSSGSEQTATKHSPTKQRKSSNSMATQASSSSQSSASAAPPDLLAVVNIIMSSYSNVSHIFHWKKPIESGIIFAIGLMLITALTFFSIISVIGYSFMSIILASGSMRIYKAIMKALNKPQETPVDHIWEKVLSLDVSISGEKLHELVNASYANLNFLSVCLKQVLLFEEKVASILFFLFSFLLTELGSKFNGLTLITIIYVSLFSVPILYEKNKSKIDGYLDLAKNPISLAISMVTGKKATLATGSQSGSKKQE